MPAHYLFWTVAPLGVTGWVEIFYGCEVKVMTYLAIVTVHLFTHTVYHDFHAITFHVDVCIAIYCGR